MRKTIDCAKCHKSINIEGLMENTENMPETELNVICPHCKYPNEVLWPLDGSYRVTAAN